MAYFVAEDPSAVEDLQCAVCLDVLFEPIEALPCRHYYCSGECCNNQTIPQCYICREAITGWRQPNRAIINMCGSARIRCHACGWSGPNSERKNHRCDGTPVVPQQQQQHDGFQHTTPVGLPAVPLRRVQPPAQNAYAGFPQPAWPVEAGGGAAGAGVAPTRAAAAANFNNHNNNNYHQGAPPPPRQAQPAPRYQPPPPWTRYGFDQNFYDHLACVYYTFDTGDGRGGASDGRLDRDETKRLARTLNYIRSDTDYNQMWRTLSRGQQDIGFDDFCEFIAHHAPDPQALYSLPVQQYHEALFAFNQYDADGNGEIDRQEFVQFSMRQGWARSQAESDALFRQIDLNGDGGLDLHEILTFRKRQYDVQNGVQNRPRYGQQAGLYYGGGGGQPPAAYGARRGGNVQAAPPGGCCVVQ